MACDYRGLLLGVTIILVFLLFQLIGHVVYEGRLPAFRLFEAFSTTPVLMVLVVLDRLVGYRRSELRTVRDRFAMWTGTERWSVGGSR
jgi:uncharacterized membrane protein YGL010W